MQVHLNGKMQINYIYQVSKIDYFEHDRSSSMIDTSFIFIMDNV